MPEHALALVPVDRGELVEATPGPNPATSYMRALTTDDSRRSQASALGLAACLLDGMAWAELEALTSRERWALARRTEWHRVDYAEALRLRAVLLERRGDRPPYAPATVNRILVAARRVLAEARELRLMTAVDYEGAVRGLKTVRGNGKPAGRSLPGAEVAALVDTCAADPRPQGARDAAMLALLVAAGLRRAELVALDVADFDRETGALTVRGKGGKHRTTYASNGAGEALAAWLEARGDAPGPLFLGVSSGGRIDPERRQMTGQAVLAMLRRRGAEAGIVGLEDGRIVSGGFSPHDLRRTYAGDLLDAGVDLATVQHLMGHASPTTTAAYDRRPEAARRAASDRLHFPYRRPAVSA